MTSKKNHKSKVTVIIAEIQQVVDLSHAVEATSYDMQLCHKIM